jgi:hypothetical protein
MPVKRQNARARASPTWEWLNLIRAGIQDKEYTSEDLRKLVDCDPDPQAVDLFLLLSTTLGKAKNGYCEVPGRGKSKVEARVDLSNTSRPLKITIKTPDGIREGFLTLENRQINLESPDLEKHITFEHLLKALQI